MGEPVLHGVPGYVLGSDMKSAKLLVLPPAGATVVSVKHDPAKNPMRCTQPFLAVHVGREHSC